MRRLKIYTDTVLEHFKNPRNQGEMEDADAVGTAGSAECGDYMHVYIKVKEVSGQEIIDEISFQTFGCAAAIASSSMLTEMAKGKPLDEAVKLTKLEIVEGLKPDGVLLLNVSYSIFSKIYTKLFEQTEYLLSSVTIKFHEK